MLEASELNQLTAILSLATILFIVASALPPKISVVALIVLSPIQVIDTRFGTSSVVLVYVAFLALLLRRERVQLPMLPHFMFLLLWCLISTSLMPPSTYVQHGVYLFTLISAFLMFWLCYDLTMRFERESSIVAVFVATNVLVAGYCAFQLWLGPGERFVFFGIDEINMTRVREDGRLTGPFQSAEITAQYLVLMEFLLLHQLTYTVSTRWRVFLIALSLANVAFLVATGSRGEFLLLIGGAAVYLWMFRHRLGIGRTIKLATVGSIFLVTTTLVVVNTTNFGGLLDRLTGTEFNEQGIPDTRQLFWPQAWNEIVKSPVIGHGPRLRFFQEERGLRYQDHVYIDYPHNLYLFLLFTVGVPGLLIFLWVTGRIAARCWRAMSQPTHSAYSSDLARIGFIVMLLFFIDGMKIDQMRLNLSDYWHFFFGLCGVLVAICDRIEVPVSVGAAHGRGGTRSHSMGAVAPARAMLSIPRLSRERQGG